MNQETADDANAGATVCLPQDILTSIFLRLQASDLRGFRRVCKEWREVISDPVFINDYMEHGPWPLTHTIVFLRGGSATDGDTEPHNGHGFLFDENWRLVARFTVGESEDMVGTCHGLMCFLDVHQGIISVLEPFTGESLTLPLPPNTKNSLEVRAYCFGFDSGSKSYKIFHLGLDQLHTDNTMEQGLYVYTIGGGENWRRVHISHTTEAGESYKDLILADGSLYWCVDTDGFAKLARCDLVKEETTSTFFIDFLPVDDCGTVFHVMTDSDAHPCLMIMWWYRQLAVFSMGEGSRWTKNSCSGVMVPRGRRLTGPQALQRGQLLLQDYLDGGVYAHPIPAAKSNDLGSGKLLLKIGKKKDKELAKSNVRGLFVPAPLNKVPEMGRRVRHEWPCVTTFCYAPPVSPAPLAHRCGFPCRSPHPLAENK